MKNLLVSLYAICLHLMQKASVNLKVTKGSVANRMRGATALEYVLIIAVISIVIVLAFVGFKDQLTGVFGQITSALEEAQESTTP